MSSTVSTTPSDGLTPSSASSATPAATDISQNFFKDQKSLQSYLYPTLSLIIAILVAVHACRFLERRRLRTRHAMGLDTLENEDATLGEAVTARLVRPRMYDVYLDGKEVKAIGRDIGWNEIMPLSSNVFVHVADVELTTPATQPTPQRRPWLSEDSRQNFDIIVDSIKVAILHGLELLSLYNRRAERELRSTNRRPRPRPRPRLAAPDVPDAPLDPSLPRELVTGVVILMPSVPRTLGTRHENWEDGQLPEVAIGIKDKEWKERTYVMADPESSVAV